MVIENLEEFIKPFSQCLCDVREDKDITFGDIYKYFEKHKIIEDDDYVHKGKIRMLIGNRNKV